MIDAQLTVSGETFDRQLTNISLSGVCITHDKRLPAGERVQVSFRIPTQEQPVEVGGSVRWSDDSQTGIQLDGLRARDVFSLNQYFSSLAPGGE